MRAGWLGFALSMLLATAAYGQWAPEGAAERPAAVKAKKSAKKADKKAGKKAGKRAKSEEAAARKTATKAKAETSESPESKDSDKAMNAAAYAPRTTTVEKLPGALKTVHVCAMPNANVELDSERYAKSVMFMVSCTAAKGGLTPFAVYTARDTKGTAAKPVTFEGVKPDGTPDKLEMLYSVTPAREAFTKDGEELPNRHIKNDALWVVGAWAPDDRPGVCAVSAQWRIDGGKGELFLWEEAKECPKGALPKYEAKVDKKPPPLVGR